MSSSSARLSSLPGTVAGASAGAGEEDVFILCFIITVITPSRDESKSNVRTQNALFSDFLTFFFCNEETKRRSIRLLGSSC